MSRAAILVLLLAGVALVAAACGQAPPPTDSAVRLTVTEDFGVRTLVERSVADAPDTAGALLRGAGGLDDGAGDAAVFVNGIRAEDGARARVRAGDRVWADLAAGATPGIRAVVGSFPEPFVQGTGGKRLPTRIECDEAVERACDAVADRLGELGIVAPKSRPRTDGGEDNLRVVVGRWAIVSEDRAVVGMDDDPASRPVFARMGPDGRTLAALDPRGRVARRLGPGSGLVAALRYQDEAPTWLVTGTDDAGVLAAAEALDETILGEKLALAIGADGLPVALPLVAPRDAS